MNLGRLEMAAAVTVICAQPVSGQTADDPLLSVAEAVAALPGEPSIVSAAGLTRTNERLLTLENPNDILEPRKRLVIVGGLDGTAESAESIFERLGSGA